MNEIRLAQPAVQTTANAASTGAEAPAGNRSSGNTLPNSTDVAATANAAASENVSVSQLQRDVAEVNNFVQTVQRDLQFRVDEELERTVVRVVDSESGELIRQIPDDIFLELARRLKQDGEFNLLNALG